MNEQPDLSKNQAGNIPPVNQTIEEKAEDYAMRHSVETLKSIITTAQGNEELGRRMMLTSLREQQAARKALEIKLQQLKDEEQDKKQIENLKLITW